MLLAFEHDFGAVTGSDVVTGAADTGGVMPTVVVVAPTVLDVSVAAVDDESDRARVVVDDAL